MQLLAIEMKAPVAQGWFSSVDIFLCPELNLYLGSCGWYEHLGDFHKSYNIYMF